MLSSRISPDQSLRKQARRLVGEALSRWVCDHIDSASDASHALACLDGSGISDYSDDLGDETFLVHDASAPDGAYVCGRSWCACDPARERASLCAHSLAACLLIGYRSHYARLHAAEKTKPLRVVGLVVKPGSIRESQDALGRQLAACRTKLVGGAA